ncbi:uncharacterized protein LOC108023174 isoform X2 [Drosophila biarmipes]|nr:uncharacterized protein LOC108023174 isoform X2 [Drosophila biarmipes]
MRNRVNPPGGRIRLQNRGPIHVSANRWEDSRRRRNRRRRAARAAQARERARRAGLNAGPVVNPVPPRVINLRITCNEVPVANLLPPPPRSQSLAPIRMRAFLRMANRRWQLSLVPIEEAESEGTDSDY